MVQFYLLNQCCLQLGDEEVEKTISTNWLESSCVCMYCVVFCERYYVCEGRNREAIGNRSTESSY